MPLQKSANHAHDNLKVAEKSVHAWITSIQRLVLKGNAILNLIPLGKIDLPLFFDLFFIAKKIPTSN